MRLVVVPWAVAGGMLAVVAVVVVVVGRGTLDEVLVIWLSVAAAPVSGPCSGMTVSCREIEPPV